MSKTSCQAIPTRRIVLNDASQLPADYSSTPGGTLFSTTPGGTRIIYDRAFLLECRNSPLTRSPPPNMPKIPGVTCPQAMKTKENGHAPEAKVAKPAEHVDEPQFHMDI
ncbi:hypothetical protein NP493_240g02000 [Ridgeia piscesae]|uniref:Eukaryotic translation initiation factor 4E binding protein 1 n=1 Tax=Ridgeia piscesae TaxID=27915 RepID=A0AAD9UDH9_RIDPI|nr:hypothetical protein NP493_240g02000 [Ridgeia piscesae]